MQITFEDYSNLKGGKSDAWVTAIQEGQRDFKPLSEYLTPAVVERIAAYAGRPGYSPKKGDVLSFDLGADHTGKLFVCVLGKEAGLEVVRETAGRISGVLGAHRYQSFKMIAAPFLTDRKSAHDFVEAFAEGLELAAYRYEVFKPAKSVKTSLKSCTLVVKDNAESAGLRKAAGIGRTLAECVNFTRDLVNAPANELPPRSLAQKASEMSRREGIKCKSYGRKDLQTMKMGGILAVGQGSVEEPRLIVLDYGPSRRPVDFAFVGKGVTFDSGGISIKPSDGMERMKYDMAGGAAVIGILQAAARLNLDLRIVGIVPSAENMPGSTAQRPGDVIRMGSGKTVEVVNTDAEGRLLLGDGLFYAQRYKPKQVVDLATLTGSCVVALGHWAMGLLGNNEDLIGRIKAAAVPSGERVWELPLWDVYFEQIKSDIAEIKNIGGKGGGTITAAMFLKQFVTYPWAHLDIAGTAWVEEKRPYMVKGSTGSGVRLLTRMLRNN